MIFIDSNVPMYPVGGAYPHKPIRRISCGMRRFTGNSCVVTSPSNGEKPSGDVLRAAEIVRGRERQSARDALHIAVMERYGIGTIFSFDGDFDRWPGLERISQV